MPDESAAAAPSVRELPARQLLQSIVNVTEHQDCARFRCSLAETLRELMPVRDIAFIRPAYSVGQPSELIAHPGRGPGPAVGRLLDAVDALHQQGQLPQLVSEGHRLLADSAPALVLLPVLHREMLLEIVAVSTDAVSAEALFVMKAFTRLYRNFLALILESERDPLTSLLNRRTLEARLAASLRAAGREGEDPSPRPLAAERRRGGHGACFLALVDIDHFKRINDALGHLFGDEVILLVAQLLREAFRGRGDADGLFRYGGEEFVVLLPARDAAGARAALERFREAVATHRFPQLEQVTVSIGFARLAGGEVPSAVIGHADQALYFAKTHGRNRVCDFESLRASGDVDAPQRFGGIELF